MTLKRFRQLAGKAERLIKEINVKLDGIELRHQARIQARAKTRI